MRTVHREPARGIAVLGAMLPAIWLGLAGAPARGESEPDPDPAPEVDRETVPERLRGMRTRLEDRGLTLEVAYTGDFMANLDGGLARKSEYLGNLDLTLTWHTEPLLGRDLGTLFLYGLVDHGGRPSRNVGDSQTLDNIEAPDAAKLYEAWWQKSFFHDHASFLAGLYDVNSEFYAVESAEIFIHSSFGIGAELGTSGLNGPSIFPTTSLGARVKAEPIPGYEVLAAVLDGVPGDPGRPEGTRIRFDDGDGVFVIAEVARHWEQWELPEGQEVQRQTRRRRVGRESEQPANALRIALGTWAYTTRLPHLSRTNASGAPDRDRGHPGLYLTADFDATRLDPLDSKGLSTFLQLGWADGDVGQFAGYVGAGLVYRGLVPLRPRDECGFGVAAAFNGNAFEKASRGRGESPAESEVALEWTYRAGLTSWLSLQGDLQYIVNPGGLRSRPDAVVAGFRFVVDL